MTKVRLSAPINSTQNNQVFYNIAMREIRDKIQGDITIEHEEVRITGLIAGNLSVGQAARVELAGTVAGNVLVTAGRLVLNGTVAGNVTNSGGDVEVFGIINGKLSKQGGTTKVGPKAIVNG
jgi:cytoskeletal protein CcmA (bactofilin family)